MSISIKTEQQKKWNAVSRKIAENGIILLKNENNILPIQDERMAVFGRAQIDTLLTYGKRIIDGDARRMFTDALIYGGISVDMELYSIYREWSAANPVTQAGEWSGCMPEMPIGVNTVKAAYDRGCKKAIIILARHSSENTDLVFEKGGYLLTETEEQMINNVCSIFENVVLVLNTVGAIDLSFFKTNRIDVVVFANLPGVGGCDALCGVLKGEVNPSAKLTFSLAEKYEDYPSSANFGQHGGGIVQDYCEDIFVGYRYFDTFDKAGSVIFPFGYGLSYTSFSISEINVEESEDITINVTVVNTGDKYSGREVIQIYFTSPVMNDGAQLSKPKKQLLDFGKTKLLAPGECETLTFKVNLSDMASYDDTGVLGEKGVWVLEKGEYNLLVGTDSIDLINAYSFEREENIIIKKCHTLTTTLPERLIGNGKYEKLPCPPINPEKGIQVLSIGKNVLPVHLDVEKKELRSLKDLKEKEEVTYRLTASSAGKHKLSFVSENKELDTFGLIELKIDGAKVNTKDNVEIILPNVLSELTVTAIKPLPDIKEIIIEKIENKTVIAHEGKTVIQAADMYEGSFTIAVENFADDGFGQSGSCITKMTRSGMYALYRLEIEEDGGYDVSFKYAYNGESKPINNVMALFVSNIIQPLSEINLEKTYNVGENRIFAVTDKVHINLPRGFVYFKLAAEGTPFPDVAEIIVERNDNYTAILKDKVEESVSARHTTKMRDVIEYGEYKPEGIQLVEVYHNPTLMPDFLEQLNNRELATLVSGTINNVTPGGDVGANHPLLERGVPATQTADAQTGLRQQRMSPTAYPACIILAASFDRELYREFGEIMGQECNAYGVDLWLAPSINIIRHPSGGRNYTNASEDPYLSGIFAAEIIKGVQSYGVATVLKHYCANNSEFERLKSDSRVSEKALREIYIKGFEIAVKEANPWAIMSSYNHVNGIKVCESYELITTVPRDEWEWDGAFFTDWWNDSKHVEELKAGHDLKMCAGDIDGVTAALDSGELTREQVYKCAERVLNMIMKTKRVKELFEKIEQE